MNVLDKIKKGLMKVVAGISEHPWRIIAIIIGGAARLLGIGYWTTIKSLTSPKTSDNREGHEF